MDHIGAYLPLAALVLIVGLIVRARIVGPAIPGGPVRWSLPRWRLPTRRRRPPLKLVPFDRAKMDDELAELLRKRR